MGLASARFVSVALSLSCALSFLSGCVEQNGDMPSEEEQKQARENILTTAPTPKFPVNAQLEDKLVYLGCDIDVDEITPGKAFTLTHYWKVLNPVGDDWKIFIHLESPDGKKSHLNADHVPIGGKYPVALWKKGEIIRDIHRVSIPTSWPSDQLQLLVGAWKGPLRMKVTSGPHDSENRIVVTTLKVLTGAKEPPKKRLVVRKVKDGSIKIDGKLDEPAWKDAMSTGPFVRTMDGANADVPTEAKVLWDSKNLYVAFMVTDKDVWTTMGKHDDKLWTQEAVEMFINADGDDKTYAELQVNPLAATYDSWLPAYRKNENDWESGMKVAVKVDGTLDNRSDVDKGWVVEAAIPLEAAKGKEKEMKNVPPVVGTEWRANFFRMDMPQNHAQIGTAWSAPLVGDFHALDRFGTLVFADDKGNAPNISGSKPDGGPTPAMGTTRRPSRSAPSSSPSPSSRARFTGSRKVSPRVSSVTRPMTPDRPRRRDRAVGSGPP